MFIYYRVLGLVANVALCINMLCLLALLTSLGATLTLPGVAGIILTIGMAVDANVIIYERLKEEFKKRVLPFAIRAGWLPLCPLGHLRCEYHHGYCVCGF